MLIFIKYNNNHFNKFFNYVKNVLMSDAFLTKLTKFVLLYI